MPLWPETVEALRKVLKRRRQPTDNKHAGLVFLTRNPGEPLCEEEAEQLFEPFVSEGGTGLGLALVKRRVDELGAAVEAVCERGEVVFRVTSPAL